ncbi:MAG: hypothetical protein Q8S00_00980 [Deltaproteobacteria bacterium]|nr:hypothetical protein [Deltaproteobacteria bacterium]MDZ4341386.1 hypothetical protein [Candidatus Binatia bacterium]
MPSKDYHPREQLGQKFGLQPVPQEVVAKTYARNFAVSDVGSFNTKFSKAFLQRPNPHGLTITESKTIANTLGMAERVFQSQRHFNFIVVNPAETLGGGGQVIIWRELAPVEPKIEISPDAQERLSGYASLAEKVYSVIKDEAKRHGVLPIIVVRPSWSHEYEDRAGVVIEVEIKGDTEKRFNLWEAISAKLDALLDSISEAEQSFLTRSLSVIVNQSE